MLSAAGVHGWGGLNSIAMDSFTSLGTLRSANGGSETQNEEIYMNRFVLHVLLGVLLCQEGSVVSTGVLQDLAANYAGTRQLSFCTTIPPLVPRDDTETMVNFITTTTLAISTLVIALVHQVEDDPAIRQQFHHFAQVPTSWSRYTRHGSSSLSIEEIVRCIHLAHRPSFPTFSVPPGTPSSQSERISTTFSFLNGQVWHRGAMDVDVEAGIGHAGLHDREIEYLATLAVAALMRFHASEYGSFEV